MDVIESLEILWELNTPEGFCPESQVVRRRAARPRPWTIARFVLSARGRKWKCNAQWYVRTIEVEQ